MTAFETHHYFYHPIASVDLHPSILLLTNLPDRNYTLELALNVLPERLSSPLSALGILPRQYVRLSEWHSEVPPI